MVDGTQNRLAHALDAVSSAPVTRCLRIDDHDVDLALAPATWETLEAIATREGLDVAGLVARIRRSKARGSLRRTVETFTALYVVMARSADR